MSNFAKKFSNSAMELKNIQALCICAVMIAMSVVLALFTINPTYFISIRFGFIALGIIGWLYGPVPCIFCAGFSDILCWLLIYGGSFSPGLFISALLTGAVYGAVWYQRKLTPLRVFLAMLIVGICINLLLNTYWNSIMYGDAYFTILPGRLLKNIVTIPLNSVVFILIAKPLSIACKRLGFVKT